MGIIIVSGSDGLIGSEVVDFYAKQGLTVVGIDNNMREKFFGKEASILWNRERLKEKYDNKYIHYDKDIREFNEIEKIFKKYTAAIELIVHSAAQPSHDWAAMDPFVDFGVNANGTLVMLELFRKYAPKSVFIFLSTNKVYGDTPNNLPLVELETRWEIEETHPYYEYGIDENMSIDHSKHSLFGVSKAAADLMVQEYGRYFGLKTGIFRGGCLTGPTHSGTKLHGFLSYLMKCAVEKKEYIVFGYKEKQVRDNIHSYDLVNAMNHFYQNPKVVEVYNMGGSRYSHCSMKEAIKFCEEITGNKMKIKYAENNRIGDHIWWVSNVNKFKNHFPTWEYKFNVKDILIQIYDRFSRGLN